MNQKVTVVGAGNVMLDIVLINQFFYLLYNNNRRVNICPFNREKITWISCINSKIGQIFGFNQSKFFINNCARFQKVFDIMCFSKRLTMIFKKNLTEPIKPQHIKQDVQKIEVEKHISKNRPRT